MSYKLALTDSFLQNPRPILEFTTSLLTHKYSLSSDSGKDKKFGVKDSEKSYTPTLDRIILCMTVAVVIVPMNEE